MEVSLQSVYRKIQFLGIERSGQKTQKAGSLQKILQTKDIKRNSGKEKIRGKKIKSTSTLESTKIHTRIHMTSIHSIQHIIGIRKER